MREAKCAVRFHDVGQSLRDVVLVLVLLAFLATGCVAPIASAPAPSESATTASPALPMPSPEPLALTVVHSNDTWGYLDPCG